MLDALKFVQGAVAKKDYVPALTHFRIEGGKVLGHNGSLALCSPIDLNLTCSPRASQFIKAIQTCKETVQLHLDQAGRLVVTSGGFRCHVDCTPEPFPAVVPEGDSVEVKPGFLAGIKAVAKFIATDASRPWARGILFKGACAYATNNVVLVQKWLGPLVPLEMNVPAEAIEELLRIGEDPVRLQVAGSAITFHFENGRWLRARLQEGTWPNADELLDTAHSSGMLHPVPESLFPALADLKPFVDDSGHVFFLDGRVATCATVDAGASAVVPVPKGPIFNIQQLGLLEGVADAIDLDAYPNPCTFLGEGLRGVIVGMRA